MTTLATRALPDTSRSLITPEYMESRKFGIGPDLAIRTGAMFAVEAKDLPPEDADKPILRMCGSSTIEDLQEDTMMYSALQSMRKVPASLTLFQNHSYDLPDDAFGKLYSMPDIQIVQNGIADLWLSEETFLRNPPAKRTHEMIVIDKARFGCSVGCQVLSWTLKDPDDIFSPILIHEVQVVEWSVVGIPANQRCWVENAIKGLFANSLTHGDGESALRLTPAFKGLYPRDFASVVDSVTSDGLRKDMHRLQARGTTPRRIMFSFENDGFYLEERGVKKSLTREETADLLAQIPTEPAPSSPDLDRTETMEEEELDETKAACGKTSWPLMDIGTEWTGSKAEKQIFDWAGEDDFSAAKAKQCFLWYDPDTSDKQSGYKLPFCYVSGSPKIVPLGVRAVANILSGGRGGADLGGAEGAIKGKVKTLYGRINSEFNPDPKWEVPWEKEDKSLASLYAEEMAFMQSLGFEVTELDNILCVKCADGILIPWVCKDGSMLLPWLNKSDGVQDTTTGSELIRQDLGEVKAGEEEELVMKADGSHAPFTGEHEHSHSVSDGSQGGDQTHTHRHSHDGDADHGHSHAEKSIKSAGCGCCDACTGKAGCTCCAQCTMTKDIEHTHVEEKSVEVQVAADGVVGFQPTITTSTSVDGGTAITWTVTTPATSDPHVTITSSAPTPEQLAYLTMYNDIGKKLGFPEHTLTTKCDLVPTQGDAGIVRSTLSALDDCSDAMMDLAQRTDNYVDALMAMMGVPDTNDMDGDGAMSLSDLVSIGGTSSRYSLTPGTTKEGRELSSTNRQKLQAIHDMVASMHPDVCKTEGMSGDGTSHQDGSQTVEEAQEAARQMGQGDSYSNLSSFVGDALKASLAKALEGISTKAIVEAEVTRAVDIALTDARAEAEHLRQEITVMLQHVAKLSNMPLGRPTNLQRTVTPVSPHAIDNTTTYEELLSVAGITGPKQTLQEVLSQTSIIEVPVTRSGSEIRMKYRRWSAGVGGAVGEGVRPPLTTNQKTLMHFLDWDAYASGGAVDVPVIDDPAERL